MLHAIGRKTQTEDVVELLLECHARIRTFLGLAMALGRRADTPLGEVVDGCSRVARYFAEAMPLHVQDEEESILPRLRGRSAEVDSALDQMREEHATHVEPLGRLLDLCATLHEDPADPMARAELADAAQELEALVEPHLEAEEEIVFAAVRALLSGDEQDAILHELRARRSAP